MSEERILCNNAIAEQTIQCLNHELSAIKNEKIHRKIKEIEDENSVLRTLVEQSLQQLISLEKANGKTVMTVPNSKIEVEIKENKKKECIPKAVNIKEQSGAAKIKPDESKDLIDVGCLDFRVGQIIEVSKHPDADSLYLEKIDCGEEKPRTVVSGLVKFIPIEEMQNKLVIVLCNLKPAKMRGIISEAMVMCASTSDKVEILNPPIGSKPGDVVSCEGYLRHPEIQLNPKKKIFETLAPDLKTNEDLIACYKGAKLFIEGKGVITSNSLKNVQVK